MHSLLSLWWGVTREFVQVERNICAQIMLVQQEIKVYSAATKQAMENVPTAS